MKTHSLRKLGRCSLAIAIASAAGVAQAQEPASAGKNLEEVIVKAQRRA